jgi:hypothetical protein
VDQSSSLQELQVTLPDSFYDHLLKDVSAESLAHFISKDRVLKKALFPQRSDVKKGPMKEGTIRKKIEKGPNPSVRKRFRRFLRERPESLEEAVRLWKDEHHSVLDFMNMVDRTFFADNFLAFRDFLGPDRLFISLYVSGYCADKEFTDRLDAEFWEKGSGKDALKFFDSLLGICQNFAENFGNKSWLQDYLGHPQKPEIRETKESDEALRVDLNRERKRRVKVENKLKELELKTQRRRKDLDKFRSENKQLKAKMAELKNEFSAGVEKKVAEFRQEWFSRYEAVKQIKDSDLKNTHKRLDGLLKRAEKSFKLQREADEEYGLISAVCQQLLQVELILDEIKRIYRDSMKVHGEVGKVKRALLAERKRLHALPGIDNVFKQRPDLKPKSGFVEGLRLLDPIPENLSQLQQYEDLLNQLAVHEVIEEPGALLREIEDKKVRITEELYQRFRKREGKEFEPDVYVSLDEFVRSGRSKRYCIYVDGYNLLLNLQGAEKMIRDEGLSKLRDTFIKAVDRRSDAFGPIVLAFDGYSQTSYKEGEVEILFSDKQRGITADSIITDLLSTREDKKSILVTRDNEIISDTAPWVYAHIDPLDFYTFIFDLPGPIVERNE